MLLNRALVILIVCTIFSCNSLEKKSKSDKMMYLVILLLAVIIGLMLYIILGNKKKVRF